jgi:hypothetical protein
MPPFCPEFSRLSGMSLWKAVFHHEVIVGLGGGSADKIWKQNGAFAEYLLQKLAYHITLY